MHLYPRKIISLNFCLRNNKSLFREDTLRDMILLGYRRTSLFVRSETIKTHIFPCASELSKIVTICHGFRFGDDIVKSIVVVQFCFETPPSITYNYVKSNIVEIHFPVLIELDVLGSECLIANTVLNWLVKWKIVHNENICQSYAIENWSIPMPLQQNHVYVPVSF